MTAPSIERAPPNSEEMETAASFPLTRDKKKGTSISGSAHTSVRRSSESKIGSSLYADAPPKRHVIFDLRGRSLRFRVVPSRIVVLHAVDLHVVVMRRPLPRAHRRITAGLQEFLFHRGEREILISFHLHRRFAVRNYFAAPSCPGHDPSSPVFLCKSWLFCTSVRQYHVLASALSRCTSLDAANAPAMQRIPSFSFPSLIHRSSSHACGTKSVQSHTLFSPVPFFRGAHAPDQFGLPRISGHKRRTQYWRDQRNSLCLGISRRISKLPLVFASGPGPRDSPRGAASLHTPAAGG